MPFQFWAVSALVGCEHLDTAVGRYRAAEGGGRGREPVQGWAVPKRSNPTPPEKRGWEPVWLSGCSESLKFNTRSKETLFYAMRASGQCTRALSNKNTRSSDVKLGMRSNWQLQKRALIEWSYVAKNTYDRYFDHKDEKGYFSFVKICKGSEKHIEPKLVIYSGTEIPGGGGRARTIPNVSTRTTPTLRWAAMRTVLLLH